MGCGQNKVKKTKKGKVKKNGKKQGWRSSNWTI